MVVIGISHQCQDLHLQEKVALANKSTEQAHFDIISELALCEVAWLSTCGRTECIAVGNSNEIKKWFNNYFQLTIEEQTKVHVYEGVQAVEYLLEITCGLQSKIVGELQILGQFKQAILQAQNHQSLGPQLSFWLPAIRSESKQIREQSGLSACAMSVPNMIKQMIKALEKKRMIVVGAGFISQQNLNFFAQQNLDGLKIIGRNREAIVKISKQLNIDFALMSSLPEAIVEADVVISATSSQLPFVSKELISKVQKSRNHKPLLICDLAMPRDVESEVAEIKGVTLATLDDISNRIMTQKSLHNTTIAHAKNLITQTIKKQQAVFKSQDNKSTLLAFRKNIEAMRKDALIAGKKELDKGADPVEVLSFALRNFSRKVMHGPTTILKKASSLGQPDHAHYMNIFIKSINTKEDENNNAN